MNSHHLVSREDQLRAKQASRRAAAAAPIEEMFAKLLQPQRLNSELAKQAGRPAKQPWDVKLPEPSK